MYAIKFSLIYPCLQVFSAPCVKVHGMIGENMKSIWLALTVGAAKYGERLNKLCTSVQSLASYADLNVAGFRKLLKQFEKQIPPAYRIPVLGVSEYRNIVVDLPALIGNVQRIQKDVEELIQALSPGAGHLISLRIGNESLLALKSEGLIDASTTIKTGSTATPASSPELDFKDPSDGFFALLQESGIDVEAAMGKLLRV
jgi:hypothetical protein